MAILMLLALALVAPGCDFIRDPEPLGLPGGGASVHSILIAGSDTVSAFLTRVDPDEVYRYGDDMGADTISGADVRIVSGDDTVRLAEAPEGFPHCHRDFDPAYTPDRDPEPAGPGCYAGVLPGGVRSGALYELLVRLADGGTIHGVAAVPAAPTLAAPEAWARFRERSVSESPSQAPIEIPVRWTTPSDAGIIELSIGATAVFKEGAAVDDGRCRVEEAYWASSRFTSADSSRFAISYISCLEPSDSTDRQSLAWDSIHARLRVTAYDSAFTRYQAVMGEKSAPPEAAAAGLTGALGVFAGAASAERPILILPEPRPEP